MNKTSDIRCTHILIVERNQGMMASLRAVLERAGHRTTEVGNGSEALRAGGETMKIDDRVDIAIIAYMLPDMTGVELIRKMNYKGILPRVVIVRCPKGDEALLEKIVCRENLKCDNILFLSKYAPEEEYLSAIRNVLYRDGSKESETNGIFHSDRAGGDA